MAEFIPQPSEINFHRVDVVPEGADIYFHRAEIALKCAKPLFKVSAQ
jgi:hypothetical protein